ncbi:hypothetical protein D0C36_21790 [Mucilaginibacter conchicola]|uniref:Outer membrane protein beta-barrel domain-containing protein n=1 Tax=Mucilaginibacter conchicola TaxID=2303333 RepID=A0A372NP79_9SPHI|nr:hypothetical protein [Mucilaginibacter conchicola]RFZ90427.1 hypothetical protein D0C36_21790 [Mucilaginibacter conchicola]
MKILIVIIALIASAFCLYAQDTIQSKIDTNGLKIQVNTNPIIFADLGFLAGRDVMLSSSINYQYKRNLFILRGIATKGGTERVDMLPTPAVVLKNNSTMREVALLYGQRFIKNGVSFSASLGISSNSAHTFYKTPLGAYANVTNYYVGMPYEFTFMWFRSKKRPFKLLFLIPVGKPSGFGPSLGLKFAGSISKYSFFSGGLVYGIGYHKAY